MGWISATPMPLRRVDWVRSSGRQPKGVCGKFGDSRRNGETAMDLTVFQRRAPSKPNPFTQKIEENPCFFCNRQATVRLC
jgi:hypothetical protein